MESRFEEAKEYYPDLMKGCHEENFNAAYDWAKLMLKPGKTKAYSHFVKDFLHKDFKVYTTKHHFSAIMFMLDYKSKPIESLNSFFFYISKDIYKILTWYEMMEKIERNVDWYYDMNTYAKRHITVPTYRNYIEWRKLREKYTELESYKLYKEEYKIYFNPKGQTK